MTSNIFPLTGWQTYLLGLENQPEANIGLIRLMTLDTVLLVKPGINLRRLERAFKQLCDRHDVTRMQFHQLGGDWRCCINPNHATGIAVHDFNETSEAQIYPLVRAHIADPIPIKDPALVQIDVLRFGSQGDALVFRAHHAVTDGYGIALLTEDLIALALGVPLHKPTTSYKTYFNNWCRPRADRLEAIETFWGNKLLPPPKRVNIGRVKQAMPLLSGEQTWQRSKTVTFKLGLPQSQTIHENARAHGVSPFMLMNAAFLETIAQIAAADEILYSVTLGRSDGALAQYAGHHTLHPLMRYQRVAGRSMAQVAQDTTDELWQTVAHLPAQAGCRTGQWDQRLLNAGSYPRQITTGILSATARQNTSQFAALFSMPSDTPMTFGGIEVRKLDLPPAAGGLDELNFRPFFDAKGGTLQFKFDSDAYSEADIDSFAEGTFSRLKIKPAGKHLLEG